MTAFKKQRKDEESRQDKKLYSTCQIVLDWLKGNETRHGHGNCTESARHFPQHWAAGQDRAGQVRREELEAPHGTDHSYVPAVGTPAQLS